jgi:hypothetical protein
MPILLVQLLTLSLFYAKKGFSQQDNYGWIRGSVIDETTQSPLPAVNIQIEGSNLGAAADLNGNFIIEHVPSGIYNLRFTMIGYEIRIVNNVVVNPGLTTWKTIELKPAILEMKGVKVTAGYFHGAKDAVVSNKSMDFEEIRTDPGSAEDIQRVVQALPAVVSGADQDNEIIVRGGMPGENLFVMDHMEIPNPNHFGYQGAGGGPINMINAQFVRRVDFYAGAFPARYGDRASSVMDISLREGSRDRITGHGYLGMSGAGLIVEGPLFNTNGSYILSARKSFLDLIIAQTGLTAVPKYYSLQGKIVYDINSRHKLIMNGIYGNDKIEIVDDKSGYARGAENVRSLSHQYALGTSWKMLFGKKGYSMLTLYQTLNHWDQYVYDENENPYYENLSTETVTALKEDLFWIPSKRFEVNFGAQIKFLRLHITEWADADTIFTYDVNQNPPVKTGVFLTYDEFNSKARETTTKTGTWFQLKFQPLKRLSATLGIRTDYFSFTDKSAWDPRIGFSYTLDSKTRLNLAFGKHSQTPSNILLVSHPLNKDLDYKQTQQVVLGLGHLFREDIRGTIEVYYKDYRKVPIAISDLTPDPFDASYGHHVSEGKGYAKGIEVFLQKKMSGQSHFTISYAYSIPKGYDPRHDRYYNWDYDYRHVFTFISGLHFDLRDRPWYQKMSKTTIYKIFAWLLPFADQLEIGIRWRYLGGRPYTRPIYYPNYQQWIVDDTVLYNTSRYPEYHRLDFRLDRRFMFKGWNMVTYFDVMNVYARDNIWGYSYQDDGSVENIYQFRVFPVGGITIEF